MCCYRYSPLLLSEEVQETSDQVLFLSVHVLLWLELCVLRVARDVLVLSCRVNCIFTPFWEHGEVLLSCFKTLNGPSYGLCSGRFAASVRMNMWVQRDSSGLRNNLREFRCRMGLGRSFWNEERNVDSLRSPPLCWFWCWQ